MEEQLSGTSGTIRLAEKGRVGGLVNPVFENTNRVLMDRRLKLLREMGQKLTSARRTDDFWNIVINALADAELDIPGCVAYGIHDQCESDSILTVVGQIGLEYGHEFFPGTLDLNALSEYGLEGYISNVLLGDTVVIEKEPVLAAFERRGWGDELNRAVLVPIKPSATKPPQGVLFLLLSARRPYDEDYALFIELLTRQIATSLTGVQLLEEEIRRAREIAEADRRKGEELERALQQRTKELRASQGFMGRLAEICPVGIFVSDRNGEFSFVNDTWVDSPYCWLMLVSNHVVSTITEPVALAFTCPS
jgi:PAS domain-containing protein